MPTETSAGSTEWTVKKAVSSLVPGDRIIFSEAMGGEGETVTVECLTAIMSSVAIHTEELDFAIAAMPNQWIEIDLKEGEQE